ncbi:MAG TPA: hypothetical protein EYN96_13180 [Candidatus Hydrogenedentes bacterium]|nr:hypothetical protein [Candidatus Hydrogenedentota bacterium]
MRQKMKSGIVTQAEGQRVRLIRWRRWVPLILVIASLLSVRALDTYLKESESNGFRLKEASWSVSVDDVGAVWESLMETSTWVAISKERGDPLREEMVSFRKTLGIRLSPNRWNTWLGSGAVISGLNGDTGITVKPGVLFRLAHVGVRLFGEKPMGAVYSNGSVFYAWQNGFICFSESRGFVESMLSEEGEYIRGGDEPKVVAIALSKPYLLRCRVHIEDGFPVEGWIGYSVEARDVPVQLVSSTAKTDALTIAGAKPQEWFSLLIELMPNWANLDLAREMLSDIGPRMSDDEMSDEREKVWVLDDILSQHFLAVPIFTIAEEGGEWASTADVTNFDRTEIRWGPLKGWKEPWFGHTYEWCVASDEGIRVTTNQSSHMLQNADRWSVGPASVINCRIVANYREFAELIRPLVSDAADHEYFPGVNREDIEVKWANVWDRLANLESLLLEGSVVDDGVSFRGYLDASDDE